MVRHSNLKLDENIGNYEPWRINKWFKENGIAELVDYVDVVNNPSWTNDAATIVIVVKNNLTSAVAMHICHLTHISACSDA